MDKNGTFGIEQYFTELIQMVILEKNSSPLGRTRVMIRGGSRTVLAVREIKWFCNQIIPESWNCGSERTLSADLNAYRVVDIYNSSISEYASRLSELPG